MKILLVKDEPVLRAYDLHQRGNLTAGHAHQRVYRAQLGPDAD